MADRRNGCGWHAILPLVDLLAILRESEFVETTSTLRGGIPDHDLGAVEQSP